MTKLLDRVLEMAYKNDFVDDTDFPLSTLRRLKKKGYLTFEHKNGTRTLFWISNKGLRYYKKHIKGD